MDDRLLINNYDIDKLRGLINLRKSLIKEQNIRKESYIYTGYVYMIGRLTILEEQQKEVEKLLKEVIRCNEGIKNTELGMSVNRFLIPRDEAINKIKEYELKLLSDIQQNKEYKYIIEKVMEWIILLK